VPLTSLAPERISEGVYRLRAGGGGRGDGGEESGGSGESLLVCCTIGFDAPAARRLLAEMPALVVVRREAEAGPGLGGLVDLMADEARRERMGMATLLPRLADVVATWAVRVWAEAQDESTRGWLGALAEPAIGAALAAFHREPGRRWTLAALAREAGLSRSVFAQRFRDRLGQAPGGYVLDWRMALAAERLAQPGATVPTVAAGLGYGSEAAFGRAFKRVRGLSPGAARRRAAGT
jgi:AraC-like DNA-binding protein